MSHMHRLSIFAAACAVALIPATGFAHGGGGHGGIGAHGGMGGGGSMAGAPTMGAAGMSRGMSDVRTVDPFARRPVSFGRSPITGTNHPVLSGQSTPVLSNHAPALSGNRPAGGVARPIPLGSKPSVTSPTLHRDPPPPQDN